MTVVTDEPAAPTAARRRQVDALYVLVAAMLILSALLKTYDAALNEPGVVVQHKLMELALIEFELLLGSVLLLNVWPVAAWATALGTFTIFAGVSVRTAIAGASSCGCWGGAHVDPRLMAAVDVVIVALLVAAGPRVTSATANSHRVGKFITAAIMITAACAVGLAVIPHRGLVALDGGVHDFGPVPAAQAGHCEHVFRVENTASTPVRVTGFKSSCGCTVATLPADAVLPGQSAEVRVLADWSGVTGSTAATVTLQTDSRTTPKVPLVIHGQVEAQ